MGCTLGRNNPVAHPIQKIDKIDGFTKARSLRKSDSPEKITLNRPETPTTHHHVTLTLRLPYLQ